MGEVLKFSNGSSGPHRATQALANLRGLIEEIGGSMVESRDHLLRMIDALEQVTDRASASITEMKGTANASQLEAHLALIKSMTQLARQRTMELG